MIALIGTAALALGVTGAYAFAMSKVTGMSDDN